MVNCPSTRSQESPGAGALRRSRRHLVTDLAKATVRWMLPTSSVLLLAACANVAGPDYVTPDLPEKNTWSVPRDEGAKELIRLDWWTGFGDPYLSQLIERAIADNVDLHILAERINLAGLGVERERATNLPKLGVSGSTDRSRTPDSSSKQHNVSLTGISWEIDLWGKTRKSVDAQKAEYLASEADWRAGYLTLVSDVASSYFQIRQLDEQIAQQEQALARNKQILAIYLDQQREGLVASSKLLQQTAEIRALRNQLLDLQRQRTVAENRVVTLLGVPAGTLPIPTGYLTESVRPLGVPPGLPADLLARRPDVIAAEYRVLKAHQLVGRARLARLPSFGLTGTGGLASATLGTLLNGWSLGLSATVNIPIFDPNLGLDIKTNEGQQRIAADQYRKTVFTAFEEVENSLTSVAVRKLQLEELQARLADLRIVNQAVQAQLREGIVSQLEVFENERSLLAVQQEILTVRQAILDDTVTLYKAMGGGWPRTVVAADKL